MKRLLQVVVVTFTFFIGNLSAQCSFTPAISAGSSTNFCSGGSVTLTASPTINTWVQKANYGGIARDYATGFGIGNLVYMGTGDDGSFLKNDFWEYNPATNVWSQKANFGGGLRSRAVGFSIGSVGYVGTGTDGSVYKDDFWEYNPSTNLWTQKTNFPGGIRYAATGFCIGTKGYLGLGTNSSTYFNDFWEYNPSTNLWTQKMNFGGGGRHSPFSFSIGTKGYVGTGADGTSIKTDFWEYNSTTNVWTQKAPFGASTGRSNGVGFSIGNKGYAGAGFDMGLGFRDDFWEYDPSTNLWTQKANVAGGTRQGAVGVSAGGKGYIGLGLNGSGRMSDFWEYTQTLTYFWSNGAASPTTSAVFNGNYSVTVTDAVGCSAVATQSVAVRPAIVLSPNNNVCMGGSVVISASGANTYTWSANAGSAISASVSVSPIVNTSYTVTATDAGCTGSAVKHLEVTALPAATITASGATNFCNGGSVGLTAGPGGDSWIQKSNCNGAARMLASGFSINGKAYIAGGGAAVTYADFWEYDPSNNTWSQKANFAGGTRIWAVGFSIGSKGYLGTGYGNPGFGSTTHRDFWEYNPTTNIWTQKANFGGVARFRASAFVINGKGYVGLGHDNSTGGYTNDLWEYTPETDTWVQKASFPGAGRMYGTGFVLAGKGYLGTGLTGPGINYTPVNDFWEYNPSTNIWTQKANFGGSPRYTPVSFAIGNKGYLGTGNTGAGVTDDFWEYTASTDTWVQKANVPGGIRWGAFALTIGSKAYLGLGHNTSVYLNDFYEYTPAVTYSWSTLVNTATITAMASGTYLAYITDVLGCSAAASQVVNAISPTISISGPSALCGTGNSLTLLANGASTYTWGASAGSVTGASVSVSPLSMTIYTLSATDANGCSGTASKTVNVFPGATVTISGGGGTVCAGTTVNLTAGGVTTYTWSTNAGSATTSTVAVSPATTTNYVVNGTDANGCQNTATTFITVDPLPSLTVSSTPPNNTVCAGQQMTLTGAGALSFNWSGGISNGVGFTPSSSGTYVLTGTNANGCQNTLTASIVVKPLPTIGANSGTICGGTPFVVVPSGGTSYTITGGTFTVSPFSNSTYTVTGTGSNGCVSSVENTVTVMSLPIVNAATSNNTICSGESATLTGQGANTYSWSFGGTGSVTVFSPTATATHTLVGADVFGCKGSTNILITVKPTPTISALSSASIICAGESVTLTATGVATFSWSSGDVTPIAVVTPSTGTTYSLTGIDNGCVAKSMVNVLIDPCTGIDRLTVDGGGRPMIVYPNPTTGSFKVDLEKENTMMLINANGQIILKDVLHDGVNEIDLSPFAKGIYFLKLGSQNIKVVKD